MIIIKTKREIEKMAEGGKKLARAMEAIKKKVGPGVTTLELNNLADDLIKKNGGWPSFKTVKGYKFATCMCVNDCVVHGIPEDCKLKEGDILGADIGMFYKGLHTDMAETVEVGSQKLEDRNDKIKRFLEAGKKALEKAIKQAVVGNHIGDISRAIQETIENKGYSVVKELVGHGVGQKLHEEPAIPGFIKGKTGKTPILKEGMTLAIEVIYNQGSGKIIYKNNDGWTIVSRDRSLSGLFEHTIAITKSGPIILTKV